MGLSARWLVRIVTAGLLLSSLLVTRHSSLVTGVWAETSNRIVAVVNDEIITEGDVSASMSRLLRGQDHAAPTASEQPDMRQAVLQRLIEERLLVQEAKRMGLAVESEEVSQQLRELQRRLETPAAYAQMLQEAHLTEERLKNRIHEQLLIQKAIDQAIRSKIQLSPSETTSNSSSSPAADGPAEEVFAQHLLIRVSDQRSLEEAETLATQAYEHLRQGTDFTEISQQHIDRFPDVEGTTLEWVRHGELLEELDRALATLEIGEVSRPIQTRLGVHLVKVIERRRPSTAGPSTTQAQRERLYQEKFIAAMEAWLNELKQQAYIEITDD